MSMRRRRAGATEPQRPTRTPEESLAMIQEFIRQGGPERIRADTERVIQGARSGAEIRWRLYQLMRQRGAEFQVDTERLAREAPLDPVLTGWLLRVSLPYVRHLLAERTDQGPWLRRTLGRRALARGVEVSGLDDPDPTMVPMLQRVAPTKGTRPMRRALRPVWGWLADADGDPDVRAVRQCAIDAVLATTAPGTLGARRAGRLVRAVLAEAPERLLAALRTARHPARLPWAEIATVLEGQDGGVRRLVCVAPELASAPPVATVRLWLATGVSDGHLQEWAGADRERQRAIVLQLLEQGERGAARLSVPGLAAMVRALPARTLARVLAGAERGVRLQVIRLLGPEAGGERVAESAGSGGVAGR